MEITTTDQSVQALKTEAPTLTQLVIISNPGMKKEDAERITQREILNMQIILSTRPELASCSQQSIILAVNQAIQDNLTLAPAAGLVYLYPGKVLVKVEGTTKTYKDVLVYDPTANGRISIARQCGSILDHKQPECTYDEAGNVKTVSFEFLVPSPVGARWEKVTYGPAHFEKWKQKSAAKFGGNANANYTSWKGGIDPDFAGSKAIRHALKKLGTNKSELRRETPITPTATNTEPKSGITDVDFEEIPANPTETQTTNPPDLI